MESRSINSDAPGTGASSNTGDPSEPDGSSRPDAPGTGGNSSEPRSRGDPGNGGSRNPCDGDSSGDGPGRKDGGGPDDPMRDLLRLDEAHDYLERVANESGETYDQSGLQRGEIAGPSGYQEPDYAVAGSSGLQRGGRAVNAGARVIMACRDVRKAEEAVKDIQGQTSGGQGAGEVLVVHLDLGSLASVRRCAEHLLKTEDKIHLLINNAGVMACPKALTEDGIEMQFGVNHLGHFLLTCLLLPRIIRSAPARIVNVSSVMHSRGHINFDDINSEHSYNATSAYSQSKLANVLFAKELGKRLEGTGVTSYALHPGVVDTQISRHFDSAFFPGVSWVFKHVGAYFIKSPEQGAQTTIYCAVAEETANETGLYYSDCKKTVPGAKGRNAESANRLWEVSAKMSGLGAWDPLTAEDTVISKK